MGQVAGVDWRRITSYTLEQQERLEGMAENRVILVFCVKAKEKIGERE